jgi:hypothetical protein
MDSNLTTTEIEEDPQWSRPPADGHTLEGCRRSYLYELIKEGKIRSVALRRKGRQRGIPLIDRASLRKFIAAECDRNTKRGRCLKQ